MKKYARFLGWFHQGKKAMAALINVKINIWSSYKAEESFCYVNFHNIVSTLA
jgi:hypothetical protein